MSRLFLPIMLPVVFALTSCSKNNDNNPETLKRLVKMIRAMEQGSLQDSIVHYYDYDSSGKFISETESSFGIYPNMKFLSIKRNASGNIIGFKSKHPAGNIELDSTVAKIYFDNASNKYKYAVWVTSRGLTQPAIDSIIYEYDQAGRIVSELIFKYSGAPELTKHKRTYHYTNTGNLDSVKIWSYSTSYRLELYFTYNFDNAPNPINFGNEGIIFQRFEMVSPNNHLGYWAYQPTTPSSPLLIYYTAVLGYGADRFPLTGTRIYGNWVEDIDYVYQQ